MPQKDKYKDRIVNIEFNANENFSTLPYTNRFSIILVTSGKFKAILNGYSILVTAPSAIFLSMKDEMIVERIDNITFSSQSFNFHPDFFKMAHFANLDEYKELNLQMKVGVSLFEYRLPDKAIISISNNLYPQIMEWFFILGTEVSAQSDSLWVCRIKKYIIQILSVFENLSQTNEDNPVDLALDYIHTNYQMKITQEDLTQCAHLNRVSLNKLFQDRYGCTAINYLLMYRLKLSEELLIHTGLGLADIAHTTGFQYDTYFIRQFTQKRGMTPTRFRNLARIVSKTI